MKALRWTLRAVSLVLAYGALYRPWQLRWGATASEVARELPGDDLIPRPVWEATRALDIGATPEHVWPWLVQMGAHPRAGWYSYDWADNGRIPSATTIRPDLQHLAVGDVLPMTAGSAQGFRVEQIDLGQALVLRSDAEDGTVTATFALRPVGAGASRLVHRVRFRVRPTLRGAWFAAIMDVSDFIMSRRTLLGIRARAEALARRELGGPAPTDHAPETPLEFDLSIPIRQTAQEVYAALADVQDLEPLPRAAGIRMTKTPPGPTHPGTRWHEQVRLCPGLWMRIESTVTDAAPPRALGMDFQGSWFSGRLDYEISEGPDGSVLRQRETMRLRELLSPLAGQVDARLRPRLLDRLADVRDTIEARTT